MNIYLDIDGVLLTHGGTLANHADSFLQRLMADGNEVYWLTTRCRNGDATGVVRVLHRLVEPDTQTLLTRIHPTSWTTSKLEALDMSAPFRWYDDQPLAFEIVELRECGLLDSWVRVDLRNDPDQLRSL